MSPAKAVGTRWPSGVVREMSTTASSGNGLKSSSSSRASRVVTPAARCQVGDDADAHGTTDESASPSTECSTASSPGPASTIAARYGASTTSARVTATDSPGATSTASASGVAVTGSPRAAPGTTVTETSTGSSPGFDRCTTWTAPPSEPVPPAQ